MDKVSYRANIDLKYAKNLNNHETFFKGNFLSMPDKLTTTVKIRRNPLLRFLSITPFL